MSLEPFAGVFVSLARSIETILDYCLQVTVARTEPGSKNLDIHRRIIAELELPHSVRDPTFALVESLDVTTKRAVEIKTDLSGRDGVHLGVVIDTNVSNKHQQVVEGLPYLYSNVFICVEELVVTQEDRDGESKLIEHGKGFVKGLGITRAKLCWISRKSQGTDQRACLE